MNRVTGSKHRQTYITPIPDADHTTSGVVVEDTVGESVTLFQSLYLKSDGKYWKTDSDAAATALGKLVLTLAAASANDSCPLLESGYARDDSWSWTPGSPLYLSGTSGEFTHTPPTVGYARCIGFARTAEVIAFDPEFVPENRTLTGLTIVNGGVLQVNSAGNDKNIQVYHDDTTGIIKTSSGALYLDPADNAVYCYDGASAFAFYVYDGAVPKVCLHSGAFSYFLGDKVGIGTDTPNDLLEISNAGANATVSLIRSDLADTVIAGIGTWGNVNFRASDGLVAQIKSGRTGTAANVGGSLFFNVGVAAGTRAITITHTGDVGIGVTIPESITHIKAVNPILTIQDTDTSTTTMQSWVRFAESDGVGVVHRKWDVGINNGVFNIIRDLDGTPVTDFIISVLGKVGIGRSPGSIDEVQIGDTADRNYLSLHSEVDWSGLALSTGKALGDGTLLHITQYGGTNEAAGHGIKANIRVFSEGLTAGKEGGRIEFWTKANNSGTLLSRVTINSAGYVGIGTVAPTYQLDVQGTGVIRVRSAAPAFRLSETGTGKEYTITLDGNDLSFNDEVYFETGGDVGIGVADPHSKLEVAGAISSACTLFSTEGPTDNVDVSGINTLFIDTSANDVTIGGLAGGVDGQYLHVSKRGSANILKLEHAEGGGSQDINLHDGNDETIGAGKWGGFYLVCCSGEWWDVQHK